MKKELDIPTEKPNQYLAVYLDTRAEQGDFSKLKAEKVVIITKNKAKAGKPDEYWATSLDGSTPYLISGPISDYTPLPYKAVIKFTQD